MRSDEITFEAARSLPGLPRAAQIGPQVVFSITIARESSEKCTGAMRGVRAVGLRPPGRPENSDFGKLEYSKLKEINCTS